MSTRKYPTMVYVSSHDKQTAYDLAATLRRAGHCVVSTWHDEPMIENWTTTGATPEQKIAGADVNLRIIGERTEAFVQINDGGKHPGGKHVELGFALACTVPYTGRVKCILFGPPENGMQYATGITRVNTTEELIAVLDRYHVKGGPEQGDG